MGGAQIPARHAVKLKSIIVMIKLPAQAAADTGAAQNQQDGARTKSAPLAAQPSHGIVLIKKRAQEQAESGAQINIALTVQPQLFRPVGAKPQIARLVQSQLHGIVLLKQTAKQMAEAGAAHGAKMALTHVRQQKATM